VLAAAGLGAPIPSIKMSNSMSVICTGWEKGAVFLGKNITLALEGWGPTPWCTCVFIATTSVVSRPRHSIRNHAGWEKDAALLGENTNLALESWPSSDTLYSVFILATITVLWPHRSIWNRAGWEKGAALLGENTNLALEGEGREWVTNNV
jgi:hypothetical protein